MKVTAILLPLLLLATAVLARPMESDGTETDSVQLADPRHADELEEMVQMTQSEVDSDLVRERRSPRKKERGSVTGSVHREKGVGTVVQAQGQGNVWTSKGGNARVDAHGEWSKVVNGPGRAKPNYNVGIKFTGRF